MLEFLKIEVGPDHPVLLDMELFWQSQFIPDDVLMSMRGASSRAPAMNPSVNPNFDMESFGKRIIEQTLRNLHTNELFKIKLSLQYMEQATKPLVTLPEDHPLCYKLKSKIR